MGSRLTSMGLWMLWADNSVFYFDATRSLTNRAIRTMKTHAHAMGGSLQCWCLGDCHLRIGIFCDPPTATLAVTGEEKNGGFYVQITTKPPAIFCCQRLPFSSGFHASSEKWKPQRRKRRFEPGPWLISTFRQFDLDELGENSR